VCRAGMRANPPLSRLLAGWADNRSLVDQRSETALFAMRNAPRRRGRFVYSNLSYIVIGAAIDRIAGISYEQALVRFVLEPLGMTSVGYGPPPSVCGHKARLLIGNSALFRGQAADPTNIKSDNPRVFSSAGTMHMTLPDWARFLHVFLTRGGGLLQPSTVDHLLKPPEGTGTPMAKGWAEARGLPGVSFGIQGSNTMWAAAALLNEQRTRLSLVACNDGRTRIVTRSAMLAATLLGSD
jgi:D-alanyl-D-alanine carboxypeptidase